MSDLAPIAPGLFDPGPPPALIGGRDKASGRIVFPCPPDPDRFEPVRLPSEGRIWSWTVQRFPPKSPPYAGPVDPFEPFAIGYVELAGAAIVESRLEGFAFDELAVGLPCRLVLVPFAGRLSFAFAPLTERLEEHGS
ncbi:MAG: OB-fold domain-containing protein [Sphingomonadaceae bacterium]|uniref:Zn-ribbon domain-containing OB-fold protein n=1 Tax=Thermaurantiacus sp. TaxID=2820283 RepID=UPI00298EE084|nr:OB-fold domain-containing protein [Thermaurantiacus sp.]MCS6987153.1 OB-fold domain-containing protein [Sphingomonadaceae bacterium]MDW8415813.1 OB-fold domain-containing protein [Thermaurantiacus sp.]